jgi:hypothetical protein
MCLDEVAINRLSLQRLLLQDHPAAAKWAAPEENVVRVAHV